MRSGFLWMCPASCTAPHFPYRMIPALPLRFRWPQLGLSPPCAALGLCHFSCVLSKPSRQCALPSLLRPAVSWVSGWFGVSMCSSTRQGSCVVSGKHSPFGVRVHPVASPLLEEFNWVFPLQHYGTWRKVMSWESSSRCQIWLQLTGKIQQLDDKKESVVIFSCFLGKSC